MKDSVKGATSFSFSDSTLGGEKRYHLDRLEGAVVDMLLGAMSGTFIGTPASTFSLGIQQIRTKMDMCKKAPRKRHALAFLSKNEHTSRLLSQDELVSQVRVTRWFDSGLVLTHSKEDDKTACSYTPGDYSKITEYKDFDLHDSEAACQLEDVK